MVTDPVCMRQLDEHQTQLTAEFRGQTYYFHDERCREVFEQDPGQYAGVIPETTYGDWGSRFGESK